MPCLLIELVLTVLSTWLLLFSVWSGSSLHTNYPILYTAAYATAQELVRVLRHQPTIKLHRQSLEPPLDEPGDDMPALEAAARADFGRAVDQAQLKSGKWSLIRSAREEREEQVRVDLAQVDQETFSAYASAAENLTDEKGLDQARKYVARVAELEARRKADAAKKEAAMRIQAAKQLQAVSQEAERSRAPSPPPIAIDPEAQARAARQKASNARLVPDEDEDEDEGESELYATTEEQPIACMVIDE